MSPKVAYVCGPLTELDPADQPAVKSLYSQIGDQVAYVCGPRAFVPHEHYDPIKAAHFSPQEVYAAESAQILERTSVLLVVAIEPTWGGGVEVGLCNLAKGRGIADVPVVVFAPDDKLNATPCLISRMLRGGPAIRAVRGYTTGNDLMDEVAQELMKLGLAKRPADARDIVGSLPKGMTVGKPSVLRVQPPDAGQPAIQAVRFTSFAEGYDGLIHFSGFAPEGPREVEVLGLLDTRATGDGPKGWLCAV